MIVQQYHGIDLDENGLNKHKQVKVECTLLCPIC